MSSFYGNGISKEVIDKEIQETNNHIIFSKTEPTVQKAGDIWIVMENLPIKILLQQKEKITANNILLRR